MTRQTIIEKTVKIINQLPEDKAEAISFFADYLIKQYEEQGLVRDIQHIISDGRSFDFLNTEEDLYAETDLREKYND